MYSLLVLNAESASDAVMIIVILGHNEYMYSRYLPKFDTIS